MHDPVKFPAEISTQDIIIVPLSAKSVIPKKSYFLKQDVYSTSRVHFVLMNVATSKNC